MTDQRIIALRACPQVAPASGRFFVSLSLSDPLIGEIVGAFFVSCWDVSRVSRVRTEVTEDHYDLQIDLGSGPICLYFDHAA
jgi:hypothetical protein